MNDNNNNNNEISALNIKQKQLQALIEFLRHLFNLAVGIASTQTHRKLHQTVKERNHEVKSTTNKVNPSMSNADQIILPFVSDYM